MSYWSRVFSLLIEGIYLNLVSSIPSQSMKYQARLRDYSERSQAFLAQPRD